MEQLLQSPQPALQPDWAVLIRSCLVWAMDLERFGATRSDLAELRQGLLSVCGFIRDNGDEANGSNHTGREAVVDRVQSAANDLSAGHSNLEPAPR